MLPMETNAITLSNEDNYFYTDRGTYDACVLINHKFTIEELMEQFPNSNEERNIIVKELYEWLPKPINVLAAFTLLVEECMGHDIETTVSALHVITNSISPYNYLSMPREIRKDVSFSINITAEAELTTEAVFSTMITQEEVIEALLSPKYKSNSEGGSNSYSNPAVDDSYLDIPVEDLVIDDDTPIEVLRSHPDWVELVPGQFFHAKTDDMIVFEEEMEDVDIPDISEVIETPTPTPITVEESKSDADLRSLEEEKAQKQRDELTSMIL